MTVHTYTDHDGADEAQREAIASAPTSHLIPLTRDEAGLLIDALDLLRPQLGDDLGGHVRATLDALRERLTCLSPAPADEDDLPPSQPSWEDDDGQPDSWQERRDFAGDDY